jgi:hypothetical protein
MLRFAQRDNPAKSFLCLPLGQTSGVSIPAELGDVLVLVALLQERMPKINSLAARYCMRYWTSTLALAGLVPQPAAAVLTLIVMAAPAA